MSARHEPIDAVAWLVGSRSGHDVGLGSIVIERMDQENGPALFAVRNGHWVWNHRDLMWEVEPTPSERDRLFLDACRFLVFEDAARTAQDEAHKLRQKIEERYAELARLAAAGTNKEPADA